MLLCIDTGNTNTVFSVWDGTQFRALWRIATDHRRTADEYFVWLSTLMSLQKLDLPISDCIISSTVPRVVFNLRVLCNRYFDLRPLVVGKPDCLLPVQPRVDEGTTVGPDRLVNTWAAFDRYGRGKYFYWDEAAVGLAGGLFIYFYPIISAEQLWGPPAFQKWMWFSTWP